MAVLLTYLYLTYGGGSPAFFDFIADKIDEVKTVMVKDERQKEAINILKLMESRAKQHKKHVKETDKELSALIESRDTNLTEISSIGDRNFENIESYSSDILDLRFKLKEQVTREEWAQIFVEQ